MRTRILSLAACVLAALIGAALLAAPGDAVAPPGPGPAVEGEGIAEVVTTDQLICNVNLQYSFPALLTELAPEWSFVEKGQVVARTESPLIDVEKQQKEADVKVAEAELQGTLAGAATALAKAQAATADAESARQAAQQRLDAAREQPLPIEEQALALQVQQNASERSYAAARLDTLAGLQPFGLCSDFEMNSARHDVERLQAQAEYLAARTAEQKPAEKPVAVRLAEAEMRHAELESQLARLRQDAEADRQRTLCDAAHRGHVQQAGRQLDLTNRRVEAMTMRAPHAGYVVYGERWDEEGKLSIGKPVYFSQAVATIVDASQMRVRVRLKEDEIPRLRAGDAVVCRFAAVPGKTYAGKVAGILGTISTESDERLAPPGQAASNRYGTVLVALSDADAAVRPGMTARLSIAPSEQAPPGAADAAVPEDDLVLRGQLDSRANRLISAPLSGRVRWAAETGARVNVGDPLLIIDPGLEEDWREADAAELKRLDLLRQAAQLSAELEDKAAPLVRDAAQAAVEVARLKLEALKERPLASDKLNAQNALQEARWQSEQADAKRDIFKDLAARGMASAADAARYELQATLAQARVVSAEAQLDRTLRGASAPELAVAQAELDLAQAALDAAPAAAREDAAVARADLSAAETRLDTLRKQAERRRVKAESSTVVSPTQGVVVGGWVTAGDVANKGWGLMRLAESSRPVVHAALNECDLAKATEGMPATVELAGVPGRTFEGRLTAVEDWPELPWWYRDRQDQTKTMTGKLFQVVVELDEEPPFYVGMSARVRLIRPTQPAGDDHG